MNKIFPQKNAFFIKKDFSPLFVELILVAEWSHHLNRMAFPESPERPSSSPRMASPECSEAPVCPKALVWRR